MQAQKQLPREFVLVVDDGRRAQYLGLAGGESEPVEGVLAEAGHGLFEEQRVRLARDQPDAEAAAVAPADQRRGGGGGGGGGGEPLGDWSWQPAGVFGRAEVLG